MNQHGKIEKSRSRQLNLKDSEIYELAKQLAKLHGTSMSGAVKAALSEKLSRDRAATGAEERYQKMKSVLERYWAAPIKDTRSADEILGYDENGLPT